MGTFARVKTPSRRGFRYTPRRRRSLLGNLFENMIVGLIIVLGLLAWFVVWACVVAAPWVILALILKWIGVI